MGENKIDGETDKQCKSQWTFLIILTSAATTIGCAVPLGYQVGVINSPAEVIRVWCRKSISSRYNYELTEQELNSLWTVIVAMFMVGGLVAPLLAADRYGRKMSVIIINGLGMVASILFLFCRYVNSVEMLILARFIAGLAGGLTMTIVPMYLIEIGQTRQRGVLGTTNFLGISVGMLLGNALSIESVLGSEQLWHYLLSMQVIFVASSCLSLPLLPESPKYLYFMKQNLEGCSKELSKIRGLPHKSLIDELHDMEVDFKMELEYAKSYSFIGLIRSKEYRLPLLLIFALHAAESFSGVDVLMLYSTDLFKIIGFSTETSGYFTLFSSINDVIMAFVAMYLNQHFGRRPVLLTSMGLLVILELLFTLLLHYSDALPWIPYLCIVNVFALDIACSIGLTHIPEFIANELFVVGPASAAMAYTNFWYWSMLGLVALTFPPLKQILSDYMFLPSALNTVIVGVFVWFYLPETKDRNPEDIAEMLKHGWKSNIK